MATPYNLSELAGKRRYFLKRDFSFLSLVVLFIPLAYYSSCWLIIEEDFEKAWTHFKNERIET